MHLLLNVPVPRNGTLIRPEMIERTFVRPRAFVLSDTDADGNARVRQVPASAFQVSSLRKRRDFRLVEFRPSPRPPAGKRVTAKTIRMQDGIAVETVDLVDDEPALAAEATRLARRLVAAARAEAHRRVLELVPSWSADNYPQKQINLQAHATALLCKETKESLSAAEQTFADTAEALWREIKKIRVAENQLADAISQAAKGANPLTALGAIDPADAVHWPPPWTWPDTVPEA